MNIPQFTTMSRNMQYAYMSLWSLLEAPLIYNRDMAKLDEFRLNVLCKTKVIEVNPYPLGECCRVLQKLEEKFVLVKKMSDGSETVRMFNHSLKSSSVTNDLKDLYFSGKCYSVDFWRQ